MSRVDLAFAFAQARLQARYGDRPSAAVWSHAEASGDLATLLQLVRGTALARWTGRLGEQPRVHFIESRLRAEWQRDVAEVAGWQPPPWQAAVEWLRWLPFLPPLQKLARGGHPQSWMRDDSILGPVVARGPQDRVAALQHTDLEPLAAAFRPDADVTGAWAGHWRSLWPGPRTACEPLDALHEATARHAEHLARLPDEARARETTSAFRRRLQLFFRRHPLSPTAAVAYLGLVGLDLARLRGLLAVRALREESAVST